MVFSRKLYFEEAEVIKEGIYKLILETEQMTRQSAEELLALDIERHRDKVNIILRQVSELMQEKYASKDSKSIKAGSFFM